ncbi:uncharacterized protein LOC135492861 [Lineus longissimus]|uniref:uncharacterized protein LOC135492861 n=1 Tax=Lineus longissimus TaxID=88925 RepID=UPI00315D5594
MWLDIKKMLVEFIPILMLSMVLVDASNANEVKPTKCKPGQFFKLSAKGGKCTKCSDCPPNHMIVQPCGGLKDSRCEAFLISTFNVGPSGDDRKTLQEIDDEMSGEIRCRNQKRENVVNLVTSAVFWKEMSFALIGVIGVLICVIIFLAVQYARSCKHSPGYKTIDLLARRSRVFSRDRCSMTEHQRHLSALESLEAQLSRGDARVLIGADGHQYIDEVFSRDTPGVAPSSSSGPGCAQSLQPPIFVPNLSANKPTTVSWTPNGMIVMDSQYSKCPKRGNRV